MMNLIRKSFKRKLLVCFISVALLPLAVSCIFLVQMFQKRVAREYEVKSQEQADAAVGALTELFAELDLLLKKLAEDPQIVESVSNLEIAGSNEVYAKLYEASGSLDDVIQFDLYTSDGVRRFTTGYGSGYSDLPTYWGILKVAAAHSDETVIRGEKGYEGNEEFRLRAVRAVMDENEKCVGYVVAGMGPEDFEQVLNGYYGSQDGVCILNRFWETVYSTGTAVQENIGEVLRERLINSEPLAETWEDYSLYVSKLGETGLYCVFMSPQVFTQDILNSMYRVMILIGVFSLALSLLAAARLSASLTRPLTKMNEAMEQMQEGNLDIRIPENRADELGQLSASFNTMAGELKAYMEQQVSQQKKLNEVSIAMMQAQLNPHFLYNTLDTMKWVAKANHIPEIAVLASKLAKILRTSISKEAFITLKEEMDLVDSYAQIQSIRFQGRFTFICDLPSELGTCIVPKLIVQPIVENAVIHGLSDCDQGTVHVTARREEGGLAIDVEDDGCGISQEIMDSLNQENKEKMAGHLGFYNVDTIIRLHYGEKYGLAVYRLEQGGTRVTIRIPERRRSSRDDKSSGC